MNETIADVEQPYLSELHAVRNLREYVDKKLDELSDALVRWIETPAEECMRAAERRANQLREENSKLRHELRNMEADRDAWKSMYKRAEVKA